VDKAHLLGIHSLDGLLLLCPLMHLVHGGLAAVAESFFSSLKDELLYHCSFKN
jgi:hypothetical protein